jgi:hypothetical protein
MQQNKYPFMVVVYYRTALKRPPRQYNYDDILKAAAAQLNQSRLPDVFKAELWVSAGTLENPMH